MFENRVTDRIIYDREYMDRLIRENYEEIYKYCWRHVRQRETAEDLTQEVFLRFLGNIDRYREYGRLRNYLYVTAGNLIRDYYRKKKELPMKDAARESVRSQGEPDYEKKEKGWAGSHEESAEIEQTLERIRIQTALDGLSAEERDLVILRYYQGLKIRDIAAVTGAPASTVRYRLKKAEDRLKRELCGGEANWTEN